MNEVSYLSIILNVEFQLILLKLLPRGFALKYA